MALEWFLGDSNTALGVGLSGLLFGLVALGVAGEQLLTGDAANEASTFLLVGALGLVAAIAFAVRYDGLLVCLALGAMPYAGWWMASMSVVRMYPPAPTGVDLVLRGLATGLIYGGPLGVVGFVLGAGGRRVFTRVGETTVSG